MTLDKNHIEEWDVFISDSFLKFANKTRDIARSVIYGRNKVPPKVQNILREYGDVIINGMIIRRTKINTITTGFIKALSQTLYDKL